MTLIEALEQNSFSEINEPVEKVIETVLSKVFIYKNTVLKVYKHSKNFIGDFEDFNFRRNFYEEDFSWNQAMSPSVYLALKPLKITNGVWEYCNPAEAEDFLIGMNRVNTEHDMLHVCLENRMNKAMVKNLVNDFQERITALTEQQKNILPSFKSTWQNLFDKRLDEIPAWVKMSADKSLCDEIEQIISTLKTVLNDAYIKDFDNSTMQVAIDNQAVNVIFNGDNPVFIDVYLMKEFWRVVDPYLNICRIAVDIVVLSNAENEKMVFEEYKKHSSQQLPERIYWAYMIYNALIMAPYFYMLQNNNVANKYVEFIHKNLKQL